MKEKHKAAFLSAVICPGVGQLHTGYKKLAYLLIGLVCIGSALLCYEVGKNLFATINALQAGLVEPRFSALIAMVFNGSTNLKIAFYLCLSCWGFSILHVFLAPVRTTSSKF